MTSVSPAAGTTGIPFSVIGHNFPTDASVVIGNVPCVNNAVSSTMISCNVGDGLASTYGVIVSTSAGVSARFGAPVFTFELKPDGASPTAGSVAGGRLVTVTGTGVDTTGVVVDIGGFACEPTTSTLGTHTCSAPKANVSDVGDFVVQSELTVRTEYSEVFDLYVETGSSEGDGYEILIRSGSREELVLAKSSQSASWQDLGLFVINTITWTARPGPVSSVNDASRKWQTGFIAGMRENDPDRACGATFGASYRNTKCLYEHAKRMCDGASDTDMVVLVSRGLGGGDQRVSATADYPANPWAKLAMRFGGSNAIDKMAGLGDFDQHTGLYVLAGKCNAPAGWSVERGLEQVLTTEIEDLTGTSRRASVLFPNVGQHFVRSTQPDPVTNFTYNYVPSLTPRITAMSRQSGTTAGGTTVLIDGTLFDQGSVSVSLSGVTCATEFAGIGEYRGKVSSRVV